MTKCILTLAYFFRISMNVDFVRDIVHDDAVTFDDLKTINNIKCLRHSEICKH